MKNNFVLTLVGSALWLVIVWVKANYYIMPRGYDLCMIHIELVHNYASVSGAREAYSSHHVCLCVILLHDFLCKCNKISNESCNATTTQHSNTAKFECYGYHEMGMVLNKCFLPFPSASVQQT